MGGKWKSDWYTKTLSCVIAECYAVYLHYYRSAHLTDEPNNVLQPAIGGVRDVDLPRLYRRCAEDEPEAARK